MFTFKAVHLDVINKRRRRREKKKRSTAVLSNTLPLPAADRCVSGYSPQVSAQTKEPLSHTD